MSSDICSISVNGLAKRYEIYGRPADRLKQMTLPRLQRWLGGASRGYFTEFWALRDVSFDVMQGETVGIVGRNGSGKSTLLQIISGVLAPTQGRVTVHGRVAALLELGSGFSPEFTGRENVYLNAAVLGLNRDEIDARFDDILAFADIGGFIDQPVKTYSSGMAMRLAFAVQAQIDPEILIVDEALSVGDARFQAKCFARLQALKSKGTSILLVTHSTEQVVAHCDRAILLENGQVVVNGEPRPVVNRYLDLLYGRTRNADVAAPEPSGPSHSSLHGKDDLLLLKWDPDFRTRPEPYYHERPAYNPYEHRWGDGCAELMDFALVSDAQWFPSAVISGSEIILYVKFRFREQIGRPILGLTVKTKEGVTVYGTNSELLDIVEIIESGAAGMVQIARMQFRCNLAPGDYFLSLGIASGGSGDAIPHDRRYDSIHLSVILNKRFYGMTDLGASINVL